VDRQDLWGTLGSCNHGFTLDMPLGVRDGRSHPVHAYARGTHGGHARGAHRQGGEHHRGARLRRDASWYTMSSAPLSRTKRSIGAYAAIATRALRLQEALEALAIDDAHARRSRATSRTQEGGGGARANGRRLNLLPRPARGKTLVSRVDQDTAETKGEEAEPDGE
jgi:hypothetical protein